MKVTNTIYEFQFTAYYFGSLPKGRFCESLSIFLSTGLFSARCVR